MMKEHIEITTELLSDPDNRPLPIENFISPKDLRRKQNVLECVCLLATGNEIDSGEFDSFMLRLKSSIKESEADTKSAKRIHFKILIRKSQKEIDTLELESIFQSVSVIRSDIPDKLNFYERRRDIPKDFPLDTTYGLKSAPNYHFFEIIPLLHSHNTTLMLETDCYFGENWLSRIENYASHSGGFWVSGATYSGSSTIQEYAASRHINGGTALYATGDNNFQNFIRFCREVSKFYIEKIPFVAYDCLLDHIIIAHYNKDLMQRNIWQFILSQYRPMNLILNYSIDADKWMDVDRMKEVTKFAVLHKKPAPQPSTMVFMHFPKCGGTYFYYQHMFANLKKRAQQEFATKSSISLHLVDHEKKVVLGVLAHSKKIRTNYKTPNSTHKIDIVDFEQQVKNGEIEDILGFKLVSESDYEKEICFLERLSPSPNTYVTILRTPIDRYESEFYYLRDMGSWEPSYGKFEGMTFAEYIDSSLFLDNWVVRRLNNIMSKDTEVEEKHLNHAVSMLERCCVIGFIEEYSLFFSKMRNAFGFKDHTFEANPKMMNKNCSSVREPLGQEIIEKFNFKCRYDIALHGLFQARKVSGVVCPQPLNII